MAKFTQQGLQSQKKYYSDEPTGAVATPLEGLEIQAPGLTPQAAPVDSFVRTGRPNAPGAVQLGQLAKLPEPAEITNLENLSRSLGSLNTNLQNAVNSYLGYEEDRYKEIQLEAEALVATNREEDYATIARVLNEKAKDPNLPQEERDGAKKLLIRLSSDGRLERSIKSELKVQKVLNNAANLSKTLLNATVKNEEGEEINLSEVDSSNPLWMQEARKQLYEDLDLSPKEYNRVQPIVANALANARTTHDNNHIEYKYNNYRSQTNFNLTQLGQLFAAQEVNSKEVIETLQKYVDEPRVKFPILNKQQKKQLSEDLFTAFATGYLKDNQGADPNALKDIFMELSTGPMEGRYIETIEEHEDGSLTTWKRNPKQLWIYQQEDFDIDDKIVQLENQLARTDAKKIQTDTITQKGILNNRFKEEVAPLIASGRAEDLPLAYKKYNKIKEEYLAENLDLNPAVMADAISEFDTNFYRAISISDDEIEADIAKIRTKMPKGLYTYASAIEIQDALEKLVIDYPWSRTAQIFYTNNYDKFDVRNTETYKGYKLMLDTKLGFVDDLIDEYNRNFAKDGESINAIARYQEVKDLILDTFLNTLDTAKKDKLTKEKTRELLSKNLNDIEVKRIDFTDLTPKDKIEPQSDLTLNGLQKELRDKGINLAVPTTKTTSFVKDILINDTNPYFSWEITDQLFDLAIKKQLPEEFENLAKAANLTVAEMLEQQISKHGRNLANLDAALAKIKENYP